MSQRPLQHLKGKTPPLAGRGPVNLFAPAWSSNPTAPGGPGPKPSSKVQQFAREMNIGFPGSLLPIRGQKFKDFPLRFWVSKQQTFSLYHQNYLTMHEHPLTDKFLHFYTEKKRKRSLWVYVQGSSGTDSSNTVVRRSCERMFKTALFRALEAAGYEASGRKMGSPTEALHGTIRIYLQEPKAALKVDFDSLVQYLTKLINNATPQLTIKSPRPK